MNKLLSRIYNLEDINYIAESLLPLISQFPIVTILGEMGAGKTTLISNICRALGVIEEISSPTFSIIQEYSSNKSKPIFHLDLYRIEKLNELLATGIEENIESGNYECIFIEWPQLAEPILPVDKLLIIKLSKLNESQRQLDIYNIN